MKHFLIVYDRLAGEVGELVEFGPDEADESMRCRVKLEQEHRTDPNIEVVVVGAKSLEALRVTHARYFHTPDELVRR